MSRFRSWGVGGVGGKVSYGASTVCTAWSCKESGLREQAGSSAQIRPELSQQIRRRFRFQVSKP